jgi:glutathione S-transferase
MLKIYTVPVSLYCAKLRIVLRHKNLAWQEEAPPGGYRSAAYKAIVPSGNIPTLINGDLTIADSEATAEYLNDIHPEPPMLPATPDERAKIRERSRFHDTRLEPEIRALFPFIKAIQGADDLIAAQAAAISEKLRQLADLLTEFPPRADDDLMLGDCGYPATFAWLDLLPAAMNFAIDWPDAVLAYRAHVERHPAVAAELAAYRPAVSGWVTP